MNAAVLCQRISNSVMTWIQFSPWTEVATHWRLFIRATFISFYCLVFLGWFKQTFTVVTCISTMRRKLIRRCSKLIPLHIKMLKRRYLKHQCPAIRSMSVMISACYHHGSMMKTLFNLETFPHMDVLLGSITLLLTRKHIQSAKKKIIIIKKKNDR